ncbi:acylglycerol kinase, mitochondrial-like isoform X2 [Gigantopelta aegis]|uniref:acylglycerol kinase, mitochondrial-like isoform X2 n=1 Tax=Gigantopelta aegis TaxID=1735272 RepID=UPI001B888844|nr:acylglycerol kinase, mitochondrial-like isoform X2 [Gigantopelta aegis]
MAFVIKIAKTVRTHWKKSIFGACLVAYGIKYAIKSHEENLIRRAFCEEARKYGEEKITLNDKPRKVTVFLNPASQGGKGSKLFNKNAAPILYLAGMEVNVVKTEFEGQVKQFLTILEKKDMDGIVVAGGDGALLENFRQNVPVGVIPLGYTNRFAQLLFGTDLSEVRMIGEAALAVVKGVTKKFDVMKIESSEGKSTYALSDVQVGAFRDAEQRKSKYWYFGPLKHRWTYVRTAMKKWPQSFKAKISYVEATEENMKSQVGKPEPPQSSSWSWLSFLYNSTPVTNVASDEDEHMTDEWDQTIERDLDTVELTIVSSNHHKHKQDVVALDLGIGPSEPSRTDFIKEGWRRVEQHSLTLGTNTNEHHSVKKISIQPDEQNENLWFNIDGEYFEAVPTEITLLKNRLKFYYEPGLFEATSPVGS